MVDRGDDSFIKGTVALVLYVHDRGISNSSSIFLSPCTHRRARALRKLRVVVAVVAVVIVVVVIVVVAAAVIVVVDIEPPQFCHCQALHCFKTIHGQHEGKTVLLC